MVVSIAAMAVVTGALFGPKGTDRLVHNQRALYLKRLLIFEPRVILASVLFQLTKAAQAGIVSTILPNCSAASMRSCAARASASGKVESTTGFARPLLTSS
jgi:hypothetical protein